jgi:formylmethanofuran dehydrogenase subunit E
VSACVECGRATDRHYCDRCHPNAVALRKRIPHHTPVEVAPTADAYLNEKVLTRCLFCGSLIIFPKWRLTKDDPVCGACF